MTIAHPTIFWIATCAIVVAALILPRPILLPFALGATLANLLAPAIDRLERTGMNRALAAVIVVLVLRPGRHHEAVISSGQWDPDRSVS